MGRSDGAVKRALEHRTECELSFPVICHDVRQPKNRKLACLLQPSSLSSPTSFLRLLCHILSPGGI